MNKWDKRFIDLAQLVASWSKDPSTKCGCVIAKDNRVISQGFNGYPKGVADNLDDERGIKYDKTIHAEVNAILHAKCDLSEHTLYVTPLLPCIRCATVIIQSGIKRVVAGLPVEEGEAQDRWKKSNDEAWALFEQAGVSVTCESVSQ